MSKAAFILDMPDSCRSCPFNDSYYCELCGSSIEESAQKRQVWCPLKEVTDRDEPKKIVKRMLQGMRAFYVCPVCGKKVTKTDKYCRECGQRLGNGKSKQ